MYYLEYNYYLNLFVFVLGLRVNHPEQGNVG